MKNTFPDYLLKFHCIADKCSDTCCAGWEIVVDDESFEKYSALSGNFAEKLCGRITTDGDGERIFKQQNGRCSFLLENGLCEMFAELGEASLCRTCRIFPRHITGFGARIETGLSLSCPEGARIVFESDTPIQFISEEFDGVPELTSIDPNLYFTLLRARKCSIEILQNRNFSIQTRIADFLMLCETLSPLLRKKQCEKACETINDHKITPIENDFDFSVAKRVINKLSKDFSNLEFLDASQKEVFLKTKEAKPQPIAQNAEFEFENLMVYFVFRYLMLAVFDGDLLTKAKFAAISFLMLRRIQANGSNEKSERIKAIQKYSKEVEHSDLNMAYIFSQIKKSRYYSTENIINMLMESQHEIL